MDQDQDHSSLCENIECHNKHQTHMCSPLTSIFAFTGADNGHLVWKHLCSRTGSRAQVKGKWFYLTNPSPVLQRCRSPIFTNQTISSWPALSPARLEAKRDLFPFHQVALSLSQCSTKLPGYNVTDFTYFPSGWVCQCHCQWLSLRSVSKEWLKNTSKLPHLLFDHIFTRTP